MINLGQGHLLTLAGLSSIHTFQSFFSETTWSIKAKFYMKHLYEVGTIVYINNPGHMTKLTVKTLKISDFNETLHEVWMTQLTSITMYI